MSEEQVSSEDCRLYNSGKPCYRATKGSGCPYVHDYVARKAALEKKRLALEEKKLAASRAKLQEQYNKDLTTKSSNEAKEGFSKCANTAKINSKIEAIINQANTDIQGSTSETLKPDIISNLVAKINDIKLENVTITPFETVHQLSWATVIYSKPVAQWAKAHSDIVEPTRKVCKFFLAGYCRKGDRCDFSHDQPTSTASEVPNPRSTPVAENLQVAVGQSKELVTYASTASKGIVVREDFPQAEQPNALVAALALPVEDGLINFNKNSWDTYNTLASWASKNLRLTPRTKLLTPYILAGRIPRKALFAWYNKAPDSAVFHPFQRLPPELRIKIWGCALKDYHGNARVVWKWDDYYMGNYYRSRLESVNPPPAFLHVNKEARILACRHFALSFGTIQAGPETFFNFEQDRLFLNTAYSDQILDMTKQLHDRERNLIRYLQVPLRDFIHNQHGFVDAITRFKDLQELYLAVADTFEDEHWARDPRMAKKATRAIQQLWVHRQNKLPHPAPVPQVYVNLIDGLCARYYGIDGITWGGKTHPDYITK